SSRDEWHGFDLQLMSALDDVSGVPTEGKNLIIVAAVKDVLHFRIFSGDGKVIVDTDEKRLMEQAGQIKDLTEQLRSLWPHHQHRWMVDTDEKRLREQAGQIKALTEQLRSLWPPHQRPRSDKDRVITAVTSIVGHTQWH